MGFFYGVTCFNNLSYEDFTFVFSMFFFLNNSSTLDYLTFNFMILAFFFCMIISISYLGSMVNKVNPN
jgi:hypothetical protein